MGSSMGWMAMHGLNRLSDRIAQAGEQRKVEAQKAGTLRKYLSLVDPDNKDTYTTAGLPDLEGAMLAHSATRAREMDELRKQSAVQEMALRQQQLQQMQLAQQQTQAFANQYRQGTAGPMAQAMAPQDLMGLAIQNPYAAQSGSALMRSAMDGQETPIPEHITDELTGMRHVVFGNSILPSGQIPGMATTNLPNVPGYNPVPTGRGGVSWLKAQTGLSASELLKSYQADLKALEGMEGLRLPADERAARRKEIQQRIDDLRAGKPADGGGGDAPDEVEYDLVDGKLVQKKR